MPERLVAVGLEILERDGERGLTTRAACEAARVTAPTLYHHFGTLDGYVSAIVSAAFAAFLQRKRRAAAHADPVRAVRDGWDDYVAFAAAFPNVYAALIGRVLVHPDLPAALEARAILESRLRALGDARRLRVPLVEATDLLWASAHAAAMLHLSSRGRAPSRHVLVSLRDAAMHLAIDSLAKE